MSIQQFYQAGGSLSPDIPSYVPRQADDDLYNHLKAGDFCYVLTARQMGKSSLKNKVMQKLGMEGWVNIDVDITSFGSKNISIEEWYSSFLYEIADNFDLGNTFQTWWKHKENLTPVARMSIFWEDFLLSRYTSNVVIYIDEVDSLLNFDKSVADDFFAAIRSTYNGRGAHPALRRLNFCIFGVAAPQDLMSDHKLTPFNIGVGIRLDNFTPENAAPLLSGFQTPPEIADALLERIFYWTNGQPYLTQKLCQECSKRALSSHNIIESIDKIVRIHFLKVNILNNIHLSNIQRRIFEEGRYNLSMLEVYRQLLNNEFVPLDNRVAEQLYLKLTGIAHEEAGYLKIYNRIYQQVFSSTWLQEAYSKIDRPFVHELANWFRSNRSDEALLKGKELIKMENWAADREDLSPEEAEFLKACRYHKALTDKEQHYLAESKKQDEEWTRRLEWVRKKLNIFLLFSILLVAFASWTFWRLQGARKNEKTATNQLYAFKLESSAFNLKNQNIPLSLRLLELAGKYENTTTILDSIYELYKSGNFYQLSMNFNNVSPFRKIAFSSKATTILTSGFDYTVRLWNVQTGRELNHFKGHRNQVSAIAIAPDGKMILTGSRDRTAKLWRVNKKMPNQQFVGHPAPVSALCFSPDGKFTLVGAGLKMYLWDNSKGSLIKVFQGHQDTIRSVAFSTNGKFVLSGADDGQLLMSPLTSQSRPITIWTFQSPIKNIAVSPNGKYFATSAAETDIILWNALSLQSIKRFSGHKGAINNISFAPNGQYLLSASDDQTVRLWSIQNMAEMSCLQGHQVKVAAATFSPDGRSIQTITEDNKLRKWSPIGFSELGVFEGHDASILSLGFSPNARYANSVDKRTVITWDINKGKEINRVALPNITASACSPDGRYLLTSSNNTIVRLWDLSKKREIQQFNGKQGTITTLAFSADGAYFLSGSKENLICLWNIPKHKVIKKFSGHEADISAVGFSPNGQLIISSALDNSLILWDAKIGAEIKRFRGHQKPVLAVAFSPDSKTFLTGSKDYTARLWDIESGREISRFIGHQKAVTSVAFHSNNQMVITGSNDQSARLWSIETGKEFKRFQGHRSGISTIAFSPHGSLILTGSTDKSIRLWSVAPTPEQFLKSGAMLPLKEMLRQVNLKENSYRQLLELWDILQKEPPKLSNTIEK